MRVTGQSRARVAPMSHRRAPRALSAHDPRAGGCLCGEAGETL